MFKKISDLIRKNISVILFFAFLFFVFASFWYTNSQSSQNAKELLDYAKTTINQVDSDLNKIVANSKDVQDNQTSFDGVISDLSSLSTELQHFSNSIPDKNTDDTSVGLVSSIRNFYLDLKQNTIDKLLEKMQKRRDLTQDYLNYGQLQLLVATGTKADIKSAIDSGNKTLDFENQYLSLTANTQTQNDLKKGITDDKSKLSKLSDLISGLSDSQKMSDDQKSSADHIFNNLWPVDHPVFPTIAIEDLKTEQFNNDVSQLQNSVNAVISKFNIN
jgi:hypothetical protein